MEAELMHHDDEEALEEEDYVLLDLEAVFAQVDITPNTPYVLSGLDTPEPIMIIDDKVKLIGKYEDTIGTCFVFSENGELFSIRHLWFKELD
uniref:Transcription factor TFIIIC triple barrel domain-containing protein n=1 Tax=Populus trichocarpa TaxID=3694 RepID=A0A2K2CBB9_POPTR